jgi:hypothetical protein
MGFVQIAQDARESTPTSRAAKTQGDVDINTEEQAKHIESKRL